MDSAPTTFDYPALYDEEAMWALYDHHGPPTEIKDACDTPCKVYEIRTALVYWSGQDRTHRESRSVWRRIEAHDQDDVPVEEARRL